MRLRSRYILLYGLLCLAYRPGNGVAVILELDLADRAKPDGTLAGRIVRQEFVGGAEVAGLVHSVVEVSRHDDLVSKGQHLAPAALQVLRGGGVRQPVLSHRFVDLHFRVLRSLIAVTYYRHPKYIAIRLLHNHFGEYPVYLWRFMTVRFRLFTAPRPRRLYGSCCR